MLPTVRIGSVLFQVIPTYLYVSPPPPAPQPRKNSPLRPIPATRSLPPTLLPKQRKHQIICFYFRQVGHIFAKWGLFFAKWGPLFRHMEVYMSPPDVPNLSVHVYIPEKKVNILLTWEEEGMSEVSHEACSSNSSDAQGHDLHISDTITFKFPGSRPHLHSQLQSCTTSTLMYNLDFRLTWNPGPTRKTEWNHMMSHGGSPQDQSRQSRLMNSHGSHDSRLMNSHGSHELDADESRLEHGCRVVTSASAQCKQNLSRLFKFALGRYTGSLRAYLRGMRCGVQNSAAKLRNMPRAHLATGQAQSVPMSARYAGEVSKR